VLAATPLWVPLVVAGLGLAGTIGGTIGGVMIAQRRSDRREELNWNREREREKERWAREDVARTFDHRRDAYSDFYESLREMALTAYNHGMGLRDEEELGEWQLPTYQKLPASSVVRDSVRLPRLRGRRMTRRGGGATTPGSGRTTATSTSDKCITTMLRLTC
jgi:hypothetical protein